jgi:hypothetical protein
MAAAVGSTAPEWLEFAAEEAFGGHNVPVEDAHDLALVVPPLVQGLDGVSAVELSGSRQRGDAGRFSDWDFVVRTSNFPETARVLPAAMRSLEPLAAQWDRLSDQPCFTPILSGPVKVDLIFAGLPHVHEPPWTVDASTLAALDMHFWDWTLWLTAKVDAGKRDFVDAELEKMHAHLLEPLGVARPPSLGEAVRGYAETLPRWEQRLDVRVDRVLQDAVVPVIQLATASSAARTRDEGDATA